MRTLDLLLTLRDDLVASASSATEGAHETLDFIPGAMLLGAVAARLYRELPRAQAYDMFHSGRMRFGDGLPVGPDRAPGFPMPLCWHEKKTEGAVDIGWIVPDRLRNFQHDRFRHGEQPKQMREGHVRLDGCVLTVRKTLRMKTALDPASGRIAEGQLFGYEAICAGQVFRARVAADADLPEVLWQRLAAVIAGGELVLGRSRSAEYGRVRVAVDTPPFAGPTTGKTADGRLTLWCLSDLALIDENGQPTLEPSPERLGLGKGKVEWEATFLRFRSYVPWNAYRCAYDVERQVIRRGSVITLSLDEPPSVDRLAALAGGTGLWREAGLGWLWANPPLLSTLHPVLAERTMREEPAAALPRPEHPLIRWLEAQQGAGKTHRDAEKRARKLAQDLVERYRLARAYAGLAEEIPIGPSPSQWGSVLAKAKEVADSAGLRRSLFDGDGAVCKPKGEGWQDAFCDDAGLRSFHAWLKNVLPSDLNAIRAFARRAVDLARREYGRGNRQD